MTISIAKARSLCTKQELALVTASSRKNLPTLSASRLKQKVTLARKLRDKWLDQAQQQRRAKQAEQQARGTSAAARSQEKSDLFAEVLDRFEKQLAKVESAGSGSTAGKPKRSNPPKKARAAGHRESRAAVREAMQAEQEAVATKRAAAAAPKAPADEPSAAAAPAKKKAAKKTAKKKAAKKAGKAATARRKKAASAPDASAAEAPRPAAVKKKNLQARTAAKHSRVVQSGAVRVQKHISARGRRNQARRDSKQ